MISRTTPNGRQTMIGLKKSEIDELLANKDMCAHVYSPAFGDISIYVVDGDDKALEEEFLRIVAINASPEPGAKPQ